MADDPFLRRAIRDHRRRAGAETPRYDARPAGGEVHRQMMDVRAPNEVITLSLPVFIPTVMKDSRKLSYNRDTQIEWLEEKLKEARDAEHH
jgi:hypothetical protein